MSEVPPNNTENNSANPAYDQWQSLTEMQWYPKEAGESDEQYAARLQNMEDKANQALKEQAVASAPVDEEGNYTAAYKIWKIRLTRR